MSYSKASSAGTFLSLSKSILFPTIAKTTLSPRILLSSLTQFWTFQWENSCIVNTLFISNNIWLYYLYKGILVSDVINKDGSMRISVVNGSQCMKSFLTLINKQTITSIDEIFPDYIWLIRFHMYLPAVSQMARVTLCPSRLIFLVKKEAYELNPIKFSLSFEKHPIREITYLNCWEMFFVKLIFDISED